MTEHGLPIVGVPCCVEAQEEGGAFHKVGEKYLMAVASASHCMPLMIPALGDWYDPYELAAKLRDQLAVLEDDSASESKDT